MAHRSAARLSSQQRLGEWCEGTSRVMVGMRRSRPAQAPKLTVGRRLILHVVSGMGAVELHYGHTVGPAWGKPWPLKASTQAEMSSKLTSSSG